MKFTKQTFITAFALFSLFFGAGNLLLPPLLGYQAGINWPSVALGFMITAVVIPILGIMAHARLQGTIFDFGKKVSPTFSSIYCVLVYLIAITIPTPRTAAATHEIAIYPNFGTDSLLTSGIYFSLVLVFVLNRSKVIGFIGKFLTPLILIAVFMIIGIGLFSSEMTVAVSEMKAPLVVGILEGYQTFDAMGAAVVGAVILVTLNLRNKKPYDETKSELVTAGWISGIGLFIVYAGLISVGAFFGSEILVDSNLSNDMQRANLLRGISAATLGSFGNTVLSILISLACFTTAVAIVMGTADYFKGIFSDSKMVYITTAIISCIIGIGVGQLDFHSIIIIALPILMFIYPITIVLIFLNISPEKFASQFVFRAVVLTSFIFSIPDFLGFIISKDFLTPITSFIPLSEYHMGWVLPALLVFVLSNYYSLRKKATP